MKKNRLFFLLTILAFALAEAAAGTVYFVNDQDWDHVSAYCAVGEEWERPITKWPGVRMLPTETKVNGHYVYEFEYDDRKGYDRIIFNNDSVGQTMDLMLESGKIYYALAGRWYNSAAEIPAVEELPGDTIYFVNLIHWNNTCAYMAVGENWRPQNAVWPGVALKSTGKKAFGGDVWMLVYPEAVGYDHLIFCCPESGEQTLDLVPQKGEYFVCNRTKTGTVDGKWQALQPQQPKKKAQARPASSGSKSSASSSSSSSKGKSSGSKSSGSNAKKKQQAKKKAAAKRR